MDNIFTYLIKSAAILGIFYIIYALLLKNETYFKANRWFLLSGILFSVITPFMIITQIEWVEPTFPDLAEALNSSATNENAVITEEATNTITLIPNAQSILLTIYILGLCYFLARLALQLWSLRRKINSSEITRKGKHKVVHCNETIAPFSFFNTIVFNHDIYTDSEFDIILKHEKAHCNQKHSIDVMLSHLLLAVQWYNPFAWLYQKAVQQNLEFLADQTTIDQNITLKNYQQLLIKAVEFNTVPHTVTNNFYQSLIKKRILMLNQKQTKKQHWKLAIILPLLVGFIFAFNTQTIAQVKPVKDKKVTKEQPTNSRSETPKFVKPIRLSNKVKIASKFGMRKDPINKTKKMHNGLDYSAPAGTPVYAAADGFISFADNNGKHGNQIVIKHSMGYKTKYAHLQKIKVKANTKVKAGDIIGTVGNTGLSTGPHLHFEVLINGKNVDPGTYVGSLVEYHIKNDFSDKLLTKLVNHFNENNKEVNIMIKKVKRDADNKIIEFTFATKFKGQKEFQKRFFTKHKEGKPIVPIIIEYIDTKKGILVTKKDNHRLFITKDNQKLLSLES